MGSIGVHGATHLLVIGSHGRAGSCGDQVWGLQHLQPDRARTRVTLDGASSGALIDRINAIFN